MAVHEFKLSDPFSDFLATEANMNHSIPAGFRMAGVYSGVKRDPKKKDLTLIVSDQPATAAGVYTQNRIVAAPVVLSRQRTPSAAARAIIINSGNANACTGPQGDLDAQQMVELTAAACGCEPDAVVLMSTGIIGHHLAMEKIEPGIQAAAEALAADGAALENSAAGILTTDLVPKISSRSITIGGQTVGLLGIAKGSGMIGPNMATMLGVVLTDAAISPVVAQPMLADVAAVTFNCISVDGHTSTNDSLVFMASGAVAHDDMSSQDVATFQQALEEVCTDLARAIADDGEGATHLIEIRIDGASTDDEAICLAQSVANSPLVKTAIAGNDPNWGRIVSAAGYAGIPFDASGVVLRLNGVTLFEDGTPVAFDAEAVSQTMQENREVLIELDFVEGDGVARFWTSDLTKEYVRINADYHT